MGRRDILPSPGMENWWHLWRVQSICKAPESPRLLWGCHQVRAQDEPDPNMVSQVSHHSQIMSSFTLHKTELPWKKDLGWKTVRKLVSFLEKTPNPSSVTWGDEQAICLGPSGTSRSPELLCPNGLVCPVSILVMCF